MSLCDYSVLSVHLCRFTLFPFEESHSVGFVRTISNVPKNGVSHTG